MPRATVRVHGVAGQCLDKHGADTVDADGGDEREREHHAAELSKHGGDGGDHTTQQAVRLGTNDQCVGSERAHHCADQRGC